MGQGADLGCSITDVHGGNAAASVRDITTSVAQQLTRYYDALMTLLTMKLVVDTFYVARDSSSEYLDIGQASLSASASAWSEG